MKVHGGLCRFNVVMCGVAACPLQYYLERINEWLGESFPLWHR